MEEYIITDRNKQNWLTAIVTVTVFMFSLDYSTLNISLPTISNYFHSNLASVALLPMVYLLIVTSSMLGFGKLGDIKGYKPLFITGLAIFTAGTLFCGISSSMNMLFGFRALQSVGEAIFNPIGMAMVTTFLPDSIKGRSLGILATAQGLGIALGALAGGFINSHFIWRGIFLVNIPLAIITLILAIKMLPDKQAKAADKRFDYLGSVLVFLSLGSFVFAMNYAARVGWKDPSIVMSFVISLVTLVLFVVRERKAAYPILDLKIFNNLSFTFGSISAFFSTFILVGFGFMAPFYFEMVRGYNVLQAGMLFMVPSLAMMLLAPIAGKLSDNYGSRFLCSAGMIMSAIGFASLAFLKYNSSFIHVMTALVFLGVGAGIFLAPNNKLVMKNAPCDKQGVASGAYKIFLNTGSVFGIAIFPLIIMHTISLVEMEKHMGAADIKHSPELLQLGFRSAFVFGVFICLAAFVFSMMAKDNKEREG